MAMDAKRLDRIALGSSGGRLAAAQQGAMLRR